MIKLMIRCMRQVLAGAALYSMVGISAPAAETESTPTQVQLVNQTAIIWSCTSYGSNRKVLDTKKVSKPVVSEIAVVPGGQLQCVSGRNKLTTDIVTPLSKLTIGYTIK